jgi:hypothetical protein
MSGMWKRSHGRTSEAPPDERGGYRYVRPTATAPHLDSTQPRRWRVCRRRIAIHPLGKFNVDTTLSETWLHSGSMRAYWLVAGVISRVFGHDPAPILYHGIWGRSARLHRSGACGDPHPFRIRSLSQEQAMIREVVRLIRAHAHSGHHCRRQHHTLRVRRPAAALRLPRSS